MKILKRGIPVHYTFSCPNCNSLIKISRDEVNSNLRSVSFSFICPVCSKGYWIPLENLNPYNHKNE